MSLTFIDSILANQPLWCISELKDPARKDLFKIGQYAFDYDKKNDFILLMALLKKCLFIIKYFHLEVITVFQD